MNAADRKKIARLVGEGHQITRVWRESFPQYSYGDVYWAAYGEGKRSAQGIQKMISTRLIDLESASKADRKALIKEIGDLVWQQYRTITNNADKLDRIRKALDR